MVVRGHFRPPTLVTNDVFRISFAQFKEEPDVDAARAELMAELTLDYLVQANNKIDDNDFLARAEMLCASGRKVIVSNCSNHDALIKYLADYKISQLGLVIGVRELSQLITDKYYQHKDGILLTAFGQLFIKNMRVYAYPALANDLKYLITLDNLPIPEGIEFLVKFLIGNGLIVPVRKYHADILTIIPHDIYHMLKSGKPGWEKFIPGYLADIIKRKQLFGYVTPH